MGPREMTMTDLKTEERKMKRYLVLASVGQVTYAAIKTCPHGGHTLSEVLGDLSVDEYSSPEFRNPGYDGTVRLNMDTDIKLWVSEISSLDTDWVSDALRHVEPAISDTLQCYGSPNAVREVIECLMKINDLEQKAADMRRVRMAHAAADAAAADAAAVYT